MTLRALNLGMPPPTNLGMEARINWLVSSMVKLDRWTQENPASVAKGFDVTNPTVNRDLDVSAATLAEVRQVLGTLLSDIAQGGAKQT